jgi:hypothetical protein
MRDKFFLPIELNAPATVAARGALGIDIDPGIAYAVRAARTAEYKKGPALQLSRNSPYGRASIILYLWGQKEYAAIRAGGIGGVSRAEETGIDCTESFPG